MSFSSDVKEELSNKSPKMRHCKLAMLAGLDGDYRAVKGYRDCCKRAFLKGAFLGTGSISDPSKAYHFEIAVKSEEHAQLLVALIASLGVEAKISKRKELYIVYVKDGAGISDLLGLMEATVSMMELENIRIVKEVRNSVNRQVNCDIANTGKTLAAAKRQIEDINYIQTYAGLESLKPELAELAKLRLENPAASLEDLGKMLENPIGKSGVNHRLAKLCEIASGLRKQNSDEGAVANKED